MINHFGALFLNIFIFLRLWDASSLCWLRSQLYTRFVHSCVELMLIYDYHIVTITAKLRGGS